MSYGNTAPNGAQRMNVTQAMNAPLTNTRQVQPKQHWWNKAWNLTKKAAAPIGAAVGGLVGGVRGGITGLEVGGLPGAVAGAGAGALQGATKGWNTGQAVQETARAIDTGSNIDFQNVTRKRPAEEAYQGFRERYVDPYKSTDLYKNAQYGVQQFNRFRQSDTPAAQRMNSYYDSYQPRSYNGYQQQPRSNNSYYNSGYQPQQSYGSYNSGYQPQRSYEMTRQYQPRYDNNNGYSNSYNQRYY